MSEGCSRLADQRDVSSPNNSPVAAFFLVSWRELAAVAAFVGFEKPGAVDVANCTQCWL